jgi:predicted dehydrogenase
MINIGVIGLGGMGMGQAKAFAEAPGCKVCAGADPSEKSRENFIKEFPNATAYTDYKQLINDKKVDAVVIVIPTLYHTGVAIEVMKSGRPVLTEKPLARTVADCHKMISASEKYKQLLMVAQCRRFDTDWGTFGKIYKAGELGEKVLWRHTNASKLSIYNPSKWFLDEQVGGGPLLDGAVHNYDYANHIFGDPESVIATSIKLDNDCTAVDTGTAVVQYKSGSQLMVSWSWVVWSRANTMDVIGTKASLTFGAGELASDKLDTKNYGYYLVANTDRTKTKLHKFKRTNMYVTQAKHFLDCIKGKTQCISPATEAIKGVAIAEAIFNAAKKNGVAKVKW